MCYNTGKPWKFYVKWKKSVTKDHYPAWFHLFELSRTGKFIEKKVDLYLPKDKEVKEKWGVTANGYRITLGGVVNVLKLMCTDDCVNGWLAWYVNYISMKLLPKKTEQNKTPKTKTGELFLLLCPFLVLTQNLNLLFHAV